MARVTLKKANEKAVLRRHPWIFSGAIARIQGEPGPGETVLVMSSQGKPLALGAYSPRSHIRIRIWSWCPEIEISPDFLRVTILEAVQSRGLTAETFAETAGRLVNAEADGIPGLIVDHYGQVIVCQFLSVGSEYWRKDIVRVLQEQLPYQVAAVYERSDADVRDQEGLPSRTGLLTGAEPPALIEFQEGPNRFLVDIRHGHKTGFYLDQSRNRARLSQYCPGLRVLNCFAYSGSFGISALRAGADQVFNIDTSAEALGLADQNVRLNGLDPDRMTNVRSDVFKILRFYQEQNRYFDLIILDPPRFVLNRAHLVQAARGYKDINLQALKLLKPGGLLFTFSCSGRLEPSLFQKIVADAAVDAQCELQVLETLRQNDDHPWTVTFPEGLYLKGLICRKRG
ncbi:class I SAM-dependent methyltransferase [bacterium]|nr:class I SAM-dependent methyltransferase [bacterium]